MISQEHLINMAIQYIPSAEDIHPYDLVDGVIDEIARSGLNYRVCPFETVVEGTWNDLTDLIGRMNSRCFDDGAKDILIHVKFQLRKDEDVTIEEKMAKYD